MATNYKESTIAGTQWTRAVRVVIENPYQKLPSIIFVEEIAMSIDGETVTRPSGNVTTVFDVANPDHIDIYTKLNALYMQLAAVRDAPAAMVPSEPVVEPVP